MTTVQGKTRSRGWRWWRRSTAVLAALVAVEWTLDLFVFRTDYALWGALYVLSWAGR
jgi:hypothetical protein